MSTSSSTERALAHSRVPCQSNRHAYPLAKAKYPLLIRGSLGAVQQVFLEVLRALIASQWPLARHYLIKYDSFWQETGIKSFSER